MRQMKTFFLAPKSVIMQFSEKYSHSIEWHATPTDMSDPDGMQVVCFLHPDEYTEAEWANTPGVQPLPHPLSSKKIHPDHHKVLSSRFGVEPTDTLHDVVAKLVPHHPCMRITGFW